MIRPNIDTHIAKNPSLKPLFERIRSWRWRAFYLRSLARFLAKDNYQ